MTNPAEPAESTASISSHRPSDRQRSETWRKREETPEPYRSVGADGGEGVGSAGKQPVPVDQQHSDVVLALLLWKHTAAPLAPY